MKVYKEKQDCDGKIEIFKESMKQGKINHI